METPADSTGLSEKLKPIYKPVFVYVSKLAVEFVLFWSNPATPIILQSEL